MTSLIALDVLALARRFNPVVVVAVAAEAECGRTMIAAPAMQINKAQATIKLAQR
jgi:hypothetical protein